MDENRPSRSQEKFIIRFPDGMRERIAEAATANKRSMNAEIVSRLEFSFSDPDVPLSPDQKAELKDTILEGITRTLLAAPDYADFIRKKNGLTDTADIKEWIDKRDPS